MLLQQLTHDVCGAVAGAVIHEHDLEVRVVLAQDRHDFSDEVTDDRRVIAEGCDHRDEDIGDRSRHAIRRSDSETSSSASTS
jgi:hypothetical protein